MYNSLFGKRFGRGLRAANKLHISQGEACFEKISDKYIGIKILVQNFLNTLSYIPNASKAPLCLQKLNVNQNQPVA